MSRKASYKRIMLKLSGEALAGQQGYGIDPDIIMGIAREIRGVVDLGVQLAIVIGGGIGPVRGRLRGLVAILVQIQFLGKPAHVVVIDLH